MKEPLRFTRIPKNISADWLRPRWIIAWLGTLLGCSLCLFPVLWPSQVAEWNHGISDEPGVTEAVDADDYGLILKTGGIAVIMATLWITELIPLAATSLLPIILFPLLGVQPSGVVARQYMNPTIFLYIGGFLVAIAMQRWNLHRRIALKMLISVGATPDRLLIGFMLASGLLSMFVSNTATTMMMITIGVSVIGTLANQDHAGHHRLSVGLMLGIAYAASIGGVATLVGTPPNLTLVEIYHNSFPQAEEITFVGWMAFALPLSATLMLAAWMWLRWLWIPTSLTGMASEELARQYRQLGDWDRAQQIVFGLFGVLVLAWITRSSIDIGEMTLYGWSVWLPEPDFLSDGAVAIGVASSLFFIPSGRQPGERLLDGSAFGEIPWGIVLLFGGGFALAAAFNDSGLSDWLAGRLTGLSGVHPILLVLVICLALSLLTELTSNAATSATVLPILAALAVSIGVDPLLLMIPATITCSFAFMLPVATPPNAIVFGAGRIRMGDMIKTGFGLNLLSVIMVTLAAWGWTQLGWLAD